MEQPSFAPQKKTSGSWVMVLSTRLRKQPSTFLVSTSDASWLVSGSSGMAPVSPPLTPKPQRQNLQSSQSLQVLAVLVPSVKQDLVNSPGHWRLPSMTSGNRCQFNSAQPGRRNWARKWMNFVIKAFLNCFGGFSIMTYALRQSWLSGEMCFCKSGSPTYH